MPAEGRPPTRQPPPTRAEGACGLRLERATPLVLAVLGLLFVTVTVLVHCDVGPPAAAAPSEAALRGRGLWLGHACVTCHQVYGLGGFIGPDLTNAWSRRGDAYLRTALRFGLGRMPRFDFSEAEVDDLAAWLRWIDATGRWPEEQWPPRGLPN